MYLNKLLITGNLTDLVELKQTSFGAVAKFRIAQTRRTKQGDETLFISVSAFGKTAEFCSSYLKKGSAVLIEGRLQYDQWKDKSGNTRSSFSVSAEKVSFAEPTRREAETSRAPVSHQFDPPLPEVPAVQPSEDIPF